MASSRVKMEKILPSIRAVMARVLVERYGMRRKEVAEILGISPQAITQYLQGVRAGDAVRIMRNRHALGVIEEACRRFAERKRPLMQAELLDLAFQVSGVLDKENVGEAEAQTVETRQRMLELLRARLHEEQKAAELFMGLAVKMQSDLTRLLFRQIATDSIRHADIITAIISELERDGLNQPDLPSVKEIEKLMQEEQTAHEHELKKIREEINNEVITLLLDSIDADEAKHDMLLSKLMEIARRR